MSMNIQRIQQGWFTEDHTLIRPLPLDAIPDYEPEPESITSGAQNSQPTAAPNSSNPPSIATPNLTSIRPTSSDVPPIPQPSPLANTPDPLSSKPTISPNQFPAPSDPIQASFIHDAEEEITRNIYETATKSGLKKTKKYILVTICTWRQKEAMTSEDYNAMKSDELRTKIQNWVCIFFSLIRLLTHFMIFSENSMVLLTIMRKLSNTNLRTRTPIRSRTTSTLVRLIPWSLRRR